MLRGSFFKWPRGPYSSCRYHNYQAIVQLFDGKSVADAVRCYLFPDYLVKKLNGRIPWWRAKERGHF